MYRESLFQVKKLDGGELNSFEFSEYSVRSKHQNLRVIVIYRPPYSDDHKVLTVTFLTEFANYIEMKVLCREELLLLSDLNIRVDAVDDNDATKFSDLLKSLGLVQHVEHATHVHGHTLDLIISRKSDTTIYGAPRIDRFLSDHGAVNFTINSNRPDITVKTASYRKLKSIDMNAFQLAIADSDLYLDPPDNPEDLAMCYNNTLKKILDDHAPLVTRTAINRPRVSWITEEIRASKRERRRAEKKWRRSKSQIDFAKFKKKRNLRTALMDKAREDFYADFIAENSHDQDSQYSCSSVSSSSKPEVSTLPPETMEESIELTEDDVESLIQPSSSKSFSLDPIPSKLLPQCDVLLPVITSLINMSLRTGVVPRVWKEALIKPLLKKPGADVHVPQNFRPFGLAQGSCLGPLLFTIYTGELSDIIKPHLPSVMCYADYTQLYVSFSLKDNCGEDEAIVAMERCIKDIQKWMKESKLQLNNDKTELLLIGTKQQLQKINMSILCVGNDLIKPSKEVKN
ncbi:uncharacterized protein [Montipora capricornis]|uniref:uncharacterized protein n=1 Tax=Montipora capricornis TaxID=246305 RepID=UPI0035F1285F